MDGQQNVKKVSITRHIIQGGSNMTGTVYTCLHTNSPGHIWTTLYNRCNICITYIK